MVHHSREWLFEAKTREERQARYDEWSSTYDRDIMEDWDYKLPTVICDLFIKYVGNRDARILDVGTGTGLGGAYLRRNGYNNLSGMDMSGSMLEQAKPKGIYERLDQMVLGEKLDYPDNDFDAILGVGTIGGAPPESFDELIRIAKPQGPIVFSLQAEFDDDLDDPSFDKKFQSLEEIGKWRLVERIGPFLGIPGESLEAFYYGFAFEVL